jgi:hypothetical protein
LKNILKKYGYPNFDKVGKETSNNLLVQHCDQDLKFQGEVSRFMSTEEADPKNYAHLTDLVNINMGKPQIYGTQVTYKDATAIPKETQKR